MIELHLHLDGSLSKDDLKQLAIMNHSEPSLVDMAQLSVTKDCNSLTDYLECFAFPNSYLKKYEAIVYASYALFTRLSSQGVLYAEVRFAPFFSTGDGLTQEEVVQAAIKGMQIAKDECGIEGQIILCCLRFLGVEGNKETVELAKKYHGYGVCAFDLAGDEAEYPNEIFAPLFEGLTADDVPYVIHAGEGSGAPSVASAVAYGAKRIGHGVNSRYDEALMDEIAKKKICIELCPTSEVDTHCIKNYEDLPLRLFLKHGIPVSISTDNMTVSNITIRQEYQKLIDTFHLTEEEVTELILNGVNAAFISEKEKENLRKKVLDRVHSWLS